MVVVSAAVDPGKPATEMPDPQRQRSSSQDDVDEQFRALMEGLRTTIPGVMTLFAFLLILPLQTSFADLRGVDKSVYYIAFGSSALASVLLIAPSAHQRVRAPISGIKRRSFAHVMTAARLALAGTVIFMVAVGAVVYLVTALVFAAPLAIVATIVVSAVAMWAWFYLPLIHFR